MFSFSTLLSFNFLSLLVVLQQEQGRRFTFSVWFCLHTDKNNSWLKYCLFLCIDEPLLHPWVCLCLYFCVFTLCGPWMGRCGDADETMAVWSAWVSVCMVWPGNKWAFSKLLNSSDSADGKVFTVAEVISAALLCLFSLKSSCLAALPWLLVIAVIKAHLVMTADVLYLLLLRTLMSWGWECSLPLNMSPQFKYRLKVKTTVHR